MSENKEQNVFKSSFLAGRTQDESPHAGSTSIEQEKDMEAFDDKAVHLSIEELRQEFRESVKELESGEALQKQQPPIEVQKEVGWQEKQVEQEDVFSIGVMPKIERAIQETQTPAEASFVHDDMSTWVDRDTFLAVKEKNAGKKSIASVLMGLCSILLTLVFLSLGVLTAGFMLKDGDDINIFGFRWFSVETNSMAGTQDGSLKKGSLVFVKAMQEEKKKEIQVGDVITFYPSGKGQTMTHRVVERLSNKGVTLYRTRGDVATDDDNFSVHVGSIVGVVKGSVPKLGTVLQFVARYTASVAIILILSILLISCVVLYRRQAKRLAKENNIKEENAGETFEKNDNSNKNSMVTHIRIERGKGYRN